MMLQWWDQDDQRVVTNNDVICRWVVVIVCSRSWSCVVARWIGDPKHLGLLDVDEKVSLEYIFALLVLLRLFVGTVIFPAKDSGTFDAINVPDSMVACRHLAVIWFAFYDINNAVEEICATMLPIESS